MICGCCSFDSLSLSFFFPVIVFPSIASAVWPSCDRTIKVLPSRKTWRTLAMCIVLCGCVRCENHWKPINKIEYATISTSALQNAVPLGFPTAHVEDIASRQAYGSPTGPCWGSDSKPHRQPVYTIYTYSATACYRNVYFAPHTQREAVAFYRAVFRKLFHFIYKHRQPSIDVSCIDTLTIVLLSTHTPTHIHLGDFGNRFELGWVMPCTDFTAQAMSEQLRKLVGSKRDHPPWKEIKFRWRHDIFCLQLL